MFGGEKSGMEVRASGVPGIIGTSGATAGTPGAPVVPDLESLTGQAMADQILKYLPVGRPVEIYSQSKKTWCAGKVQHVEKTGDINIAYTDGSGQQKKVQGSRVNSVLRNPGTDAAVAGNGEHIPEDVGPTFGDDVMLQRGANRNPMGRSLMP